MSAWPGRYKAGLPTHWRRAGAVCYICGAHATCLIAEHVHGVMATCMYCLANELELLTGYRVVNLIREYSANRRVGAEARGLQLEMAVEELEGD